MEAGLNPSRMRSAALVAVALAWAVFLTLTGSPEALLFTVPVFLLAAPLAFGRYVGEEAIAAVCMRRQRSRGGVPLGELVSVLLPLAGLPGTSRIPVRGPPSPVS